MIKVSSQLSLGNRCNRVETLDTSMPISGLCEECLSGFGQVGLQWGLEGQRSCLMMSRWSVMGIG